MKNLYNKLKEQGLISDTDKIIVTGHSLGGYLAQLFTLANYDKIDHAYTYNAPGLGGIRMNLMHLFSIDRPMKYNDKITDIVAIDGINAIHEVDINVGKEVKIAGNKHSINEIFKTIDFYDFALNNGANVDKITNYLSKMYKMTNKNVHEIAKEVKNGFENADFSSLKTI